MKTRGFAGFIALAILIAAIAGLFWGTRWFVQAPDPVTITSASLQAVRAQNRLVPFAARFVAVVTSEQSRFGVLHAKKTLIMPGLVRYELDLAALKQSDLHWDAATSTLTIALPPIQISGPEVDLTGIREYGEGGVLMALTDAEAQLDSANRNAGQSELLRQARDPLPMKLARDAAIGAIERSFVMPLKAAGFDAKVIARFEGNPTP